MLYNPSNSSMLRNTFHDLIDGLILSGIEMLSIQTRGATRLLPPGSHPAMAASQEVKLDIKMEGDGRNSPRIMKVGDVTLVLLL